MLTKLMIAATAISLSLSIPVMAQPQAFGKAVKIGRTSDFATDTKWRSALSKFKTDKKYFGALYVSDSNDRWYFIRGFHSMKNAKLAGKKGCELTAETSCSLYAVSYPSGVNPNSDASGLGSEASEAFQGSYPKKSQKNKWAAFAISGASNFGFSYGWTTQAEARESAIAYCEASVARSMAEINTAGRKWARAQGLTKCRVIDVLKPRKP